MNSGEQRIKELSLLLKQYNTEYYQNHTSPISDKEFDTLMHELIALEEANPHLKAPDSPTQRVGGTITKDFATVQHKTAMLSLSNTYSAKDLDEFDKRIQKGIEGQKYEYICELKYDGVALSLTYENGLLTIGATRGDGKQGDDITNNVKTIKTIPLKIAEDISFFEARGEAFLAKKEFERINKERAKQGEEPLANPRNTASGTLKMQDSSVVAQRNIDCYIYSLHYKGVETHEEALQTLKKWGFNVPNSYKKCNSIEEVKQYITYWEERRHDLPLETDGVVIKINSISQQEQLGFTAKSPRWAISYKYQSESASTILEDVSYQVGRTGSVTPVAHLAPVQLAGTTVKRASLHNANEIERLDLHFKDEVFVEKGGEIIPKVTGVNTSARSNNAQAVTFMLSCPECSTELIRKEGEANHYCPNTTGCKPQILGKIEHYIHRKAMDIDSLGPETLEQLFDNQLISNPADLYDLTYDQVIGLERFAEKSANNLIEGMKKSTEIPFQRVLFALGIRFVGATVATTLANHFKTINNLQQATVEELVAVHEIGERIAVSVVDYFSIPENVTMVERLKSHNVQFEVLESENKQLSDSLAGKTFVISGVFQQHSRDELKEIIQQHGGKIISSISAKLDFLVAGDKMGPSKLEKATKFGTTMIDEKALIDLISR
ncbi:MAG: NAD-dependent DNA ligase LigA [Cyclobacteriaceae bacterium]